MEVQKLVLVQIIVLLVGIQLTLFAGIGSCTHPSPSEGGKCYLNFDVESHARSSLACLEKYITEPYFEKHDSFIDSSFNKFIANELPLGLCGVVPEKLNRMLSQSIMQRYLIGEGSHRRLSSSIKLSGPLESIAELPKHMCKVIIIEKLPSGIFADPFELQHLLQRGVFADAAVFGDTNLELPSVVSNRSIVEVHMAVDYNNIVSGKSSGLEINVEVPLHARYPPLGEHGFATIEFSRPDLFLCCNIDKKSHDDSCLVTLTGRSDAQTVLWEIPCGIKQLSGVVSVVTFVSAVVAAFLIVLTSIYYPHYQKLRMI